MSDCPSQHLFWASAAVAVKYQPSPWLLYKEKEKMGWRFNPLFSRSPLLFDHHFFLCFPTFLFPFVVSFLSPRKIHHTSKCMKLCTCCFKVFCCMKLHFLKQWLTGDTALPGVDLHSGKTSCQLLVTGIEKRKNKTTRILQRTGISRTFFVLEQHILALRELMILSLNVS